MKNKILCFGILVSKIFISSANNQTHISLEFGEYWSTQGKNQFVYISGLIGDNLNKTSSTQTNGLVGASIMYQLEPIYNKLSDIIPSIGVRGFYLPSVTVSGIITQENLFNNLGFNYQITNWPVYIDLKSETNEPISSIFDKLRLTTDVGLGTNVIQAKNYKENSLDNGITVPDNEVFNNNNSTVFSVTAGVGLKIINFVGKAPLECGYRFFYLGEGSLTPNNNQILNSLKTGNSYANALICSITV